MFEAAYVSERAELRFYRVARIILLYFDFFFWLNKMLLTLRQIKWELRSYHNRDILQKKGKK